MGLDRFRGFAMLPYYSLRWCVAPKGKQHIKKEDRPRMVSYYEVLGVSEDSSQDEIKQAYRERMKAHHPDLHGQSDDPIVRLLTEAYRVLGNSADREQYKQGIRRNGDVSSAVSKARQPKASTSPPQGRTVTREICSRCEGRAYNPALGVRWPCRYCDGQGWVPGKITL
jgi:DnaJ-class molecular chaperone